MNSQTGANPNPQSGAHPDAESLNAFVEQALGISEHRQVVAHLAVCGRCRQVVALAQQAAGVEPARPAAAPVRQTREPGAWARNWRWAWAPAAALVGLMALAIVVEVRRADEKAELAKLTELAKATQPATAPQFAEARAPAQPQAAAHPEAAGPPTAGTTARKQRVPAPTGAEMATPEEMASAAFSAQGGAGQAVNGFEGAEQGSISAAHSSEPAPPSFDANEAAAWRRQEPVPSVATRKAVAPNEAQAWADQPSAARRASNGAEAARSLRAAPGASPAPAVFVAPMARALTLPSGLGMASTATKGHETVAVDSAGAVFVSQDDGGHWQPVARQWTGQAVRVQVQAPPQSKASAADSAKGAGSVFELANDQNQVWASTDGVSWSPR